MATELTVNGLRKSILNLIKSSLADPENEVYKSLTTMVNDLARQAIADDNENDINWDETDELFGEYNPDEEPSTTPETTPSSTPSDTPSSEIVAPTSVPQFVITTQDGATLGQSNGSQSFLIIKDYTGKVVRNITYIPNGSLIVSISHDSPTFTMYSPSLDWQYSTYGSDITWPTVDKNAEVTFNCSELYLLKIRLLNNTGTPEPSNTPDPSVTPTAPSSEETNIPT